MKKLYILTLLMSLFGVSQLQAQCSAGYNPITLNWDYLDYLQTTATYTNNGYVSSPALAYTQNFAFGASNRLTIAATNTITLDGNVGTQTGDVTVSSIPYTGNDVRYTINNINERITLTFETEVMNASFTLYDIEQSQSMTITAANAAAVAQPVGVVTQGGTILTVGIVPLIRTITAAGSSSSSNSNDGTATISVTGPVKTITITINAVGSSRTELYLSDITACVTGTFPNNYYVVSQPFTGQPGYVLHSFDRSVYYVNPANGFTRLLFTDVAGLGNINSLAYDPYNRVLYYVYSLTVSISPPVVGNTRVLKKYDFNTGVISTVVADINTIGVPTSSTTGLESGAAAFYNGAIYLGVETGNGSNSSDRKATIWRLDFNGSGVPYRASEVYAILTDDGGLIHDWADFVIHNGILYDFDGAGGGTGSPETDVYHYNMSSGNATNYHNPAGWVPSQPAIGWNGSVYQVFGTTASTPYIALYNGNGTIGTRFNLNSVPAFPIAPFPSVGDAGEAFRPFLDFGDAPGTYDPDPLSPASNEIIGTTLRLGTNVDNEWLTRGQTAPALSDNFDDGVGTVRIFSNLYSTYYNRVSVFNNTGANVNLRGWFDWNGNGVFEVGEASANVVVATGVAAQNITLNWTGISSALTTGASTYMRVRLSSSAMGTSASTGWFIDGETEDYRVLVNNIVLPVELLSFEAKAVNNSSVNIKWTASEDVKFSGYEVQRSHNGTEWERIAFIPASDRGGLQHYESIDNNPYKGSSKYRLKIVQTGAQAKYSDIRTVKITDLASLFTLTPNPASTKATVTITGDLAGEIAQIRVLDSRGNELSYQKVRLSVGTNPVDLPLKASWPAGTYIVLVTTDAGTVNNKLIIRR